MCVTFLPSNTCISFVVFSDSFEKRSLNEMKFIRVFLVIFISVNSSQRGRNKAFVNRSVFSHVLMVNHAESWAWFILPLQWARAALQRVEMRTRLLLPCRTRRFNTHPLASLSLSKESNKTKSRRERKAQRKHTLLPKPRKLRYYNTYMHNPVHMTNTMNVKCLNCNWIVHFCHSFGMAVWIMCSIMSLCLTSQISHHLCIIW